MVDFGDWYYLDFTLGIYFSGYAINDFVFIVYIVNEPNIFESIYYKEDFINFVAMVGDFSFAGAFVGASASAATS